jgi:hypothetical protein
MSKYMTSTIIFLCVLSLFCSLKVSKTNHKHNKDIENVQKESTVINVPSQRIWNSFKNFEFDKMFPTRMDSVEVEVRNENLIGSVFTVNYKDGSKRTNRISKIDEDRMMIEWDMVSSIPKKDYKRFTTTINITPVTETDTTYLTWDTTIIGTSIADDTTEVEDVKLDSLKTLREHFENE